MSLAVVLIFSFTRGKLKARRACTMLPGPFILLAILRWLP